MGLGVECLFNCARDICHYRRGKLKHDTAANAPYVRVKV
jgi:hypothetical protein